MTLRHRLTWPILILALLLCAALVAVPSRASAGQKDVVCGSYTANILGYGADFCVRVFYHQINNGNGTQLDRVRVFSPTCDELNNDAAYVYDVLVTANGGGGKTLFERGGFHLWKSSNCNKNFYPDTRAPWSRWGYFTAHFDLHINNWPDADDKYISGDYCTVTNPYYCAP